MMQCQCQCTTGERGIHRDLLEIALLETGDPVQVGHVSLAISDAAGRAVGNKTLLNMLRGLCHMLRL